MASPPAIRTASFTPSMAARAACTFVALELSMNRTPSSSATVSPRCLAGVNVASPVVTASAATPNASAAAAAAAASARYPARAAVDGPQPPCRLGRQDQLVPVEPDLAGARRRRRRPHHGTRRGLRHAGRLRVVAVPHVHVALPLAREHLRLGGRVPLVRAVPVEVVGREVRAGPTPSGGTRSASGAGRTSTPPRARRGPPGPPRGTGGRCCRTRPRPALRRAGTRRSSRSSWSSRSCRSPRGRARRSRGPPAPARPRRAAPGRAPTRGSARARARRAR